MGSWWDLGVEVPTYYRSFMNINIQTYSFIYKITLIYLFFKYIYISILLYFDFHFKTLY